MSERWQAMADVGYMVFIYDGMWVLWLAGLFGFIALLCHKSQ